MNNFFRYLEELCLLNGGSGDEQNVRDYIASKIKDKYGFSTDPLGNLTVFGKGSGLSPCRLMVSAHMDEVSMIVTYIKPDGTLKVSPVGGIDPRVVIGGKVTVGEKRFKGVIGSKAIHNMSAVEKKSAPKFEKLYVDIGANDKEEAHKYVSPGDRVYFEPVYSELGSGGIMAKAVDDRFGCALMLSLLENDIPPGCVFVFTVQEEIGLRGAKTAAYSVKPEFAVVIETTTASDIPLTGEDKKCCFLGGGAVVPFMDKRTIYDKELFELSKEIAAANNIRWQTKTVVAGGNDAGEIHVSNGGIRTLAVSAPVRYLHSPLCAARRSDLEDCLKLTGLMIERICTL